MKERRQKTKASETVKNESSQISLDTFIEKMIREGKLRASQFLEIETFFVTDLGLKRKEDLDTYQRALEKY